MAYIDEIDLKTYLDISEEGDDVILESCIDRAQTAIETYTNRVFEAAAGTKHYGWDAVDGLFLWLDADLQSLTSVANGDSSATAVAVADLTEWPMNEGPPYYALRLDDSSDSVWQVDTDYWIAVTGDWGFSATPPNDIVQACVRLAAYYYRQKDTGQFETVAIAEGGAVTVPMGTPEDVRTLLNPYRRFSL